MCDREVCQALSWEKCPVGTVDLEPELGDTCVGVAHLEIFIRFIFYVQTYLNGRFSYSLGEIKPY